MATRPGRPEVKREHVTVPAVNVDRAPSATGDERLVRVIGLRSAILFVVGSVIGSGIFLTTGGMAAVIPSASLLLAAWTLGGVLAIAGGLTYAEMGAMFPRSGGVYVFLKEAYGPLTAFLYGWAALFVVISGGIAAVAVGFAAYLSYFLPALTSVSVLGFSGTKLVAASVILVLGAINYSGVRSGNMVNVVTTAAKVGALASLPVMALIAARVDPVFVPIVPPGLERPAASFGVAMIAVLWTYEAWYFVTYAAGEIKDPLRNLPRALIYGLLLLTSIYVIVNVAYLYALSIDEMKGTTRIAERVATALVGPRGAAFIALTVVISTFGNNAAAILAGSRLLFAMATDGVFLPQASRVHPLSHTSRRHRGVDYLVRVAGALRHVRTALHLRDVRIHSVQRGGRGRAVPPSTDDARSAPSVSDVGLSVRAARVHCRFRRLRAQHAL